MLLRILDKQYNIKSNVIPILVIMIKKILEDQYYSNKDKKDHKDLSDDTIPWNGRACWPSVSD